MAIMKECMKSDISDGGHSQESSQEIWDEEIGNEMEDASGTQDANEVSSEASAEES